MNLTHTKLTQATGPILRGAETKREERIKPSSRKELNFP